MKIKRIILKHVTGGDYTAVIHFDNLNAANIGVFDSKHEVYEFLGHLLKVKPSSVLTNKLVVSWI